jgi:hypothetical protein
VTARTLHANPSQCSRIVAFLSDGREHSMSDIHRAVGFCRLNSRMSELRSRGFGIECRRDGGDYLYTLTHDPTQRVEATTTPEGAKGWGDPAGSAHVRTGGHGLDVAPNASPEGVRAEIRQREQDGGGEPSNAPYAVPLFDADSTFGTAA